MTDVPCEQTVEAKIPNIELSEEMSEYTCTKKADRTCLFQISGGITVDAEHECRCTDETSGDDENIVVQLRYRAQYESNHGARCGKALSDRM